MTLDPSQTGQDRHALSSALKGLRKASGLSGARLAIRCGMSQSKISRIENGRLRASIMDVQLILEALKVDTETADHVLELARVASAEYQSVRASVRRGLQHRQAELATLESEARHIRHFLPSLVTGLLQTHDYMQAAMNPPVNPVEGDTSKAIERKLRRQSVLHNNEKRFDFLLTESAIRWRLSSPSVLRLQVDHLIAVSKLPSVRLSVLPLSAHVPDGAFHTFVLYDKKLVTAELFSGRLVLRDLKDVNYYSDVFDFFFGLAEHGDSARGFLRSISDGFMRLRD
ncbi:helix-turn-helix transcriptional regulator [Kutzneria viridogrisea]|uniref:Transcriptional regulator with XRE-family HTH domain n=1 Tax=Kutzneria viridogrisea TaxID=47990 RepID=A0ABR6BQ18_9PSEU|nr:transcriptional regulator with XRE-family HTH domain [Kutzneria viridogrisea]